MRRPDAQDRVSSRTTIQKRAGRAGRTVMWHTGNIARILLTLLLTAAGILGSPQYASAAPPGCGACTPCQVCQKVATTSQVLTFGHGTYAVKGDVAVLRNPKSEIGALIGALGEWWTHTGIMVDSNNCRSDLMGGQAATPWKDLVEFSMASAFSQWIGQSFCQVGSPAVGDVKIIPANLYQGSPGVITQAMYESPYFYPYGVTLAQPAGLATTLYSPRWTMRAAANTANGINQRYGIYSYSDWTYAANQPGTYELAPKGIPNGHEGCSGFVRRALFNTGKTLPNLDLNTYPASVRQNAANLTHQTLYGNCDGGGNCNSDNPGGISDVIYCFLRKKRCTSSPFLCPKGTLTDCQIKKLQNSCNGQGTGVKQYTEGLLNQVLNCFAFGDVGNGGTQICTATNSTAWKNPGPGSGTISPQSVYDQIGTKYSATYVQEVLHPTVWATQTIYGCVAACPNPVGCSNDCGSGPQNSATPEPASANDHRNEGAPFL